VEFAPNRIAASIAANTSLFLDVFIIQQWSDRVFAPYSYAISGRTPVASPSLRRRKIFPFPFRGTCALGQRIYDDVCKEAWQQWLAHQTTLINENRLTPIEPEARKFLETEMEKFFFGEGSAKPQGYVPE